MTALNDMTGENEYEGKAKKGKKEGKEKKEKETQATGTFLADEHQSTSLPHHVSPISTKISWRLTIKLASLNSTSPGQHP